MHVFRIWRMLCVFGFMVTSLCVNEIEYEWSYDNAIFLDLHNGKSPVTPGPTADLSRWEKLFIALENSHMMQNMLLESVEQCCGRTAHLETQLDKLARGTCQQCASSMESACRAEAQQESLRLQKVLVELREEEAERETRLNATLQMLLRDTHLGNSWLKQQEEGRTLPLGTADMRMRHHPTQMLGGLGVAFSLGMKPVPSGLNEQKVTSPMDMATMKTTLVAIATDLEKAHLQLSKVIKQVGTLRKDRGDMN
uniref:pentraxin-related protein PTX3-like n=1 Tax=Monopterus albus TaxID=43700 RepID=UPI0009B4E558|nr:pentraxin-related protein PTX3-like [Monopterus albus]